MICDVEKGRKIEVEVKGVISCILFFWMFEEVKYVDIVIEVIVENMMVKIELFKIFDYICLFYIILVSNIFFLFIIEIVVVINWFEWVIGMYFMNFVFVMKLVEVICGLVILEEMVLVVMGLVEKMGKILVEVNDFLGFVFNCIFFLMINEVIYCVYEGVVKLEVIDEVMKLGMNYLMGLFILVDFIGLDMCLLIMEVFYFGFGDFKYCFCLLFCKYVKVGWFGKKSGCGFY